MGIVRPRHGFPGIRDVTHQRARKLSRSFQLRIERDKFFKAKAPISRYIDAAYEAGQIVEAVTP